MPQRPGDDPGREHRSHHVADARDESERRVQADANIRPWDGKRLVHQVGELSQRDQVLRQFLFRFDDLGYMYFVGHDR